MKNIFRKLMELEFGEVCYRKLTKILLTEQEEILLSNELVKRLMMHLEHKNGSELKSMYERLEKTLLRAYDINRGFLPYLFFCIGALGVLPLFARLIPATVIAAGGVVLCLGFRVKEYLVNRNCHLDARMVLCYRVALERVLRQSGEE